MLLNNKLLPRCLSIVRKNCLNITLYIPNSLNNVSQDIRWSLDLRWSAAGQPIGLWGMKNGVLLRSKDPNFKVDWTEFDSVDRTKVQTEFLGQVSWTIEFQLVFMLE